LTPSNAALRAALTKFSVDVLSGFPLSPFFNFSRAISYARAAFSRESKTPMYLDFPAKYNCACHFPEGLIVTPRNIAAANAAASEWSFSLFFLALAPPPSEPFSVETDGDDLFDAEFVVVTFCFTFLLENPLSEFIESFVADGDDSSVVLNNFFFFIVDTCFESEECGRLLPDDDFLTSLLVLFEALLAPVLLLLAEDFGVA
jgi:hypothetical protein